MTQAVVSALASLAFGCFALDAQSSRNPVSAPYAVTPVPAVSSGESYKTRMAPPAVDLTPFSSGSLSTADKLIEFRPESEMTPSDHDLAESAQSAIRTETSRAGIELGTGKWTYEQLACQALPDHLFLLYKSDNGARDASLFAASIPRAGNGHIRILPIERRGFSLYSPAPVNALNIAAFNRIRASESANQTPDWLATALCYAALTGAHPQTSPIEEKSGDASLSFSFPPRLEAGGDGASTVRFVDSAPSKPAEWALSFNAKGQLLKVTLRSMQLYAIKPVPAFAAEQTTKQGSQ